ncbi:tetratricopeptide repeat protein [Nodularia sp. LEGE 04288]|uniref:tetratricopeptide repeat protein n=1 Tax=Nodularia sp. LEGE 04288 TaxID=1828639 RepID=UPI001D10D17D|nr:tetratricopeptide repeat protein [Nodularia sp. LEGE 04288]MCC2695848.1 tetratricopeptide repeat protein [Nodularia sp. LEGE 04288]
MELLQIEFIPIGEDKVHFSVKVKNLSVGGEAILRKTSLPFVEFLKPLEELKNWRHTLLKVLESEHFESGEFKKPGEEQWLLDQGWLCENPKNFQKYFQHPSTLLTKIGTSLFQCIFPSGHDNNKVLNRALSKAKRDLTHLHIRFSFPEDVSKYVRLADYPWELLYDEGKFLSQDVVTFSRYIEYTDPQPALIPTDKINVLLVSSNAYDDRNKLQKLDLTEHEAVINSLRKAETESKGDQKESNAQIRLEVLESATLKKLEQVLINSGEKDTRPHVLHFDGHGFFGRRCETCYRAYRDSKECRNEDCNNHEGPLSEFQGYLLFSHETRKAHYVSANEFSELLLKISLTDTPGQQQGVLAVVLSACNSGMSLNSQSVFNGVAQSLIRSGVPAVVAMQFSVRVDAATAFAEKFYSSLCKKNSLARSVSLGRYAMGSEGNQWYRPVLYLRWQDNEGGQLFAQDQQINQNEQIQLTIPNNLVDNSLDLIKFVGRDTNIEEIDKEFQNNTRIVITGLGGIGKTTLVDQYARKSRKKKAYPGGIWVIDAQEKSVPDIEIALEECFRGLLRKSSPYDKSNDMEYTQKTFNFYRDELKPLINKCRVLLVLDSINEENYNQINKYFPDTDSQNFKVLITTPNSFGQKTIQLDVLERQASIKLLAAYAEDQVEKDETKTGAICQQLEDMPLGLEFVGDLLKRDTLENIYSELSDLKENDIKRIANKRIANKSTIFDAFEVNWKYLDLKTQTFAYLLSLFAATPISWALIKELGKEFDESEFGKINKTFYRLEAKSDLIKFNLIQNNSENFGKSHKFIQTFLQQKLEDLSIKNKFLAKNLKQIFYQVMVKESKKIPPNPTQQELENVKDSIPHFNKVVRDMKEDLEPKELVDLFTGLGRYYEGNGQYTEAKKQYENCLDTLKSSLGNQHPYIFKIQNSLAHIYLSFKNYEQAKLLYEKASTGGEEWLKDNSPDSLEQRREIRLNIAISQDYLGYAYLYLYVCDKFCSEAKGFLNEAQFYLGKASDIIKEYLTEEQSDIEHRDDKPRNLANLGWLHSLRGQWKEAKKYYTQAEEIRAKQKDNPTLAESYHNLGIFYFDYAMFLLKRKDRDDKEVKQNYDKAKELYNKSIEIEKRFYGDINIKVANTVCELAETYFYSGEYDKAVDSYQEALNLKKIIWEKHLDLDDAENMKMLAVCYLKKQNYKNAIDWFSQALNLINLIDKSKNLTGQQSLIEEINTRLNEIQKCSSDAESLFSRSSILLKEYSNDN